MKDPRFEEAEKPQKLKALAPQHSNSSETSKQARKEKKKKDKQHRGQKLQESSTLATGVNNISGGGSQTLDITKVTCFNYNKKGHFANKCPEPPKPKN